MKILNRQDAKAAKKNEINCKLNNRFSLAFLEPWRLESFAK